MSAGRCANVGIYARKRMCVWKANGSMCDAIRVAFHIDQVHRHTCCGAWCCSGRSVEQQMGCLGKSLKVGITCYRVRYLVPRCPAAGHIPHHAAQRQRWKQWLWRMVHYCCRQQLQSLKSQLDFGAAVLGPLLSLFYTDRHGACCL